VRRRHVRAREDECGARRGGRRRWEATKCREQSEGSSESSDGGRRCYARGAEARERERERESAHRVEARVAKEVTLSTAEGGGRGTGEPRMPSTRRRRPDTVGRARRGLVRARGEGGAHGVDRPGLASLAGPVGWRRPASEQPPFPFFLKLFSQTLSKFV